MKENRLRTLWKEGRTAVNGWLAIPDGVSAEVMAHQGWDALTVDLQHGLVDYPAMVRMLQAMSATPVVPVVRVPWLEPGILMKSLDAGASTASAPCAAQSARSASGVRGYLDRSSLGPNWVGLTKMLTITVPSFPPRARAASTRVA